VAYRSQQVVSMFKNSLKISSFIVRRNADGNHIPNLSRKKRSGRANVRIGRLSMVLWARRRSADSCSLPLDLRQSGV
jgi:hypothetical protein